VGEKMRIERKKELDWKRIKKRVDVKDKRGRKAERRRKR